METENFIRRWSYKNDTAGKDFSDMKYIITGGLGFLGSNIASEILRTGGDLFIYDNLSRVGGESNLEWLRTQGDFSFTKADVKNYRDISEMIAKVQPSVIYHLAGQVAMTTSITNPRLDFETNVIGSFNVLEAIRQFSPDTVLIYSSTNKIYGDLEYLTYDESDTRYICKEFQNGFDESINLDFRSPYGCSKGAADQYILDYSRVYGLNTMVFRHSSMYGSRQFGTFDQGWISWFCQKAIETKMSSGVSFTISGDGKQVRDVLNAEDMVRLYLSAPAHIENAKGQAFNIGGGMTNSLSILELFALLEAKLDVKLSYTKLPPRNSDQKVFVADISKASRNFHWTPLISADNGISGMIEWILGGSYNV
jgi:CDP-paratose 2-epimerase